MAAALVYDGPQLLEIQVMVMAIQDDVDPTTRKTAKNETPEGTLQREMISPIAAIDIKKTMRGPLICLRSE